MRLIENIEKDWLFKKTGGISKRTPPSLMEWMVNQERKTITVGPAITKKI